MNLLKSVKKLIPNTTQKVNKKYFEKNWFANQFFPQQIFFKYKRLLWEVNNPRIFPAA